ncbi:glycosyltransferase family 1 protein [Xylariaceae sp. FL0255]|nr:glycosyltransferase family 1 protein [Xylariaceae sp. FL0255]
MKSEPIPSLPRSIVLVVSHSLSGHLAPMLRIAAALHNLCWNLFFLGPTAHADKIAATGATFLPLNGIADLDDRLYYQSPPVKGYNSLHWAERVMLDFQHQCLKPLPEQWQAVKEALRTIRSKHPSCEVIVLAEAFFLGIMPLHYGASLGIGSEEPPAPLSRPKTLCISVTVPAIRSKDLPPAGYPFPFDPSPEGQERNAALWRGWTRRSKKLTELLEAKMREAGATWPVNEVFLSGANYTCHNKILQLGVPSFEYPRSDWPSGFQFAGLVQGRPLPSLPPPAILNGKSPPFPWWAFLESNSSLPRESPQRKKVVVVSQGTVEINPQDLILPTISAFTNHEDVIIVVILGWKGATLSLPSPGLDENDENAAMKTMPPNIFIADYLNYDTVLAHSDAWVHNAGFGAVNHGIANGVPMVVAGEGMDKTENARRVAQSGIGIDLGTATPTSQQLRVGIEHVLWDGAFARRVHELSSESKAIDCFEVVHNELLVLTQTSRMTEGV